MDRNVKQSSAELVGRIFSPHARCHFNFALRQTQDTAQCRLREDFGGSRPWDRDSVLWASVKGCMIEKFEKAFDY